MLYRYIHGIPACRRLDTSSIGSFLPRERTSISNYAFRRRRGAHSRRRRARDKKNVGIDGQASFSQIQTDEEKENDEGLAAAAAENFIDVSRVVVFSIVLFTVVFF